MRLKYDQEDQRQYRCCLCCHVRTGTILLGILTLFAHIVVLASLGLLLIHPDVLERYNTQTAGHTAWQTDILTDSIGLKETPERLMDDKSSSSEEAPEIANAVLERDDDKYVFESKWWAARRSKLTQEDVFVAFLIVSVCMTFAAMLVYGAAKGRASYLMPFFCVQVFAFCLTILSVVGYFTYMPDVKAYIKLQEMPFKEELLKLDNEWLCLLLAAVFCGALFIKAYLIGVVWACYKFLSRRQVAQAVTHYYANGGDDAEGLLPPKYEDIVDQPANPPPPPYAQAQN